MRMVLQLFLIVNLWIFCSPLTLAQTARLRGVEKSSIQPAEKPIPVYPNIEEKKIPLATPATVGTTNGTVKVGKPQLTVNPDKPLYIGPDAAEKSTPNSGNAGKVRRRTSDEWTSAPAPVAEPPAQELAAPVKPELNVTAVKEEPYEVKTVLAERKPQQLVSIQASRPEETSSAKTTSSSSNQYTISPLKRKFLEDRVQELEKQIAANPDDQSAGMLSVKKELEDLKKLLSH